MLAYKLKDFVNKAFGGRKTLTRIHTALRPLIPDRHFPYPFAGGRIYLNVKESPTVLGRVLRWYEISKTKAVSVFLGPGAVFVDVGANMGDFSLLAAKNVGKDGKVFSFEPDPDNCGWLRKSIQLNDYKNIGVYEIALSNVNGSARLYLGKESGWHSLLPEQINRSGRTVNVSTRTLDSVLEEAGQSRVDVMKVDVEGAELEVLKGAYETLARNRNIVLLIDLHPGPGVNPKEVYDFLSELGFSIYQMSFPFDTPARIDDDLREILARR